MRKENSMRHVSRFLMLATVLGLVAATATAQPPRERPADPKPGKADASSVDAFVARLMAFDKNMDGKLTRDEITDERLLRLFDRADTNKAGVVTKQQLTALAIS